MINRFFGYKIDQVQTFDNKGKRLVVTKIKALPLKVKKIKTEKKDGYMALQVEIKPFSKKNSKKPKKTILREIKLLKEEEIKIGDKIELKSIFKIGDKAQIKGKTIGRGFAGVVKRYRFAGGSRTHGQSDRQRAPGSIGQGTDPGRVWKGKKMPGRMGNKPKTIKGLKVFKIDEEENILFLTGLVPGKKGGFLEIKKTNKAKNTLKIKPKKEESSQEEKS